ncbi:MAG: hypothetical protein HS115_16425 [Spirochaetales bacterium]|nr:hypothetical protein [Spirochaetales bacterium]
MQFQHFQLKIFFKDQAPAMETFVPFFHKWIQESYTPELLLDVADYSHIEKGPGVLLIGHDHFYSVDTGLGRRSGFLTQRRTEVQAGPEAALRSILKAALQAALLVEQHLQLSFDASEFLLVVNDRLLGPNTPAGFTSLQNLCAAALKDFPGGLECRQVAADSRQRLSAQLSASAPQTIALMLAALD